MKRLARAAVLATVLAGVLFIAPAPAHVTTDSSCPPSQSGAPTPDQLGQPLTYVLSENCQGGAQQLDSRVDVVRADGQGQQPTDLAYAYSHSCSPGCETIAVAYQVVLVNQNNPTQSPQNAAVAINDSCDGCATFAYADQYAVDVPAGTRLSRQAHQEIAAIRQEAAQDVAANLSFPDLDSRLRALAVRLKDAVDNGLQQKDPSADHRHETEVTKEG